MDMTYKIGCDADGKLVAANYFANIDAGAQELSIHRSTDSIIQGAAQISRSSFVVKSRTT